MQHVEGLRGEKLALLNCDCGGEAEYHSTNGLVHVVRCTKCGTKTGQERCGYDAVNSWNWGKK